MPYKNAVFKITIKNFISYQVLVPTVVCFSILKMYPQSEANTSFHFLKDIVLILLGVMNESACEFSKVQGTGYQKRGFRVKVTIFVMVEGFFCGATDDDDIT